MKGVAGKFEVTTFGLRTELPFDFCRETSEGSLLVETVTLPFFGSSAVPLLNDLKLCGSKGLAAVANRARLFGIADAYKTCSRYNG
jgi:hypothetical protein